MFCNPPYGRQLTGKWVKKCYDEVNYNGCELCVLLIPARTDTKWFHEYIYGKYEIRFIKGRLKFELDGVACDCSTFPSMIVVMKK